MFLMVEGNVHLRNRFGDSVGQVVPRKNSMFQTDIAFQSQALESSA